MLQSNGTKGSVFVHLRETVNVKFYENLHVHLHKVSEHLRKRLFAHSWVNCVPNTYFVFTLPHRCLGENFQRMSMNMPSHRLSMLAASDQLDSTPE